MQVFEAFNPIYLYVTFIRDILLWQTLPTASLVVRCAIWAVASLAIGYVVFHRHEHKFILYI